MKKIVLISSVIIAGLGMEIGSAFAVTCVASTPGPLDSETGIAGVAMAGLAAFLVWRRRKA
ncbi:MAG: LPXTG cell wall anchor domain-containing protein [Aestuariivirga sp.]